MEPKYKSIKQKKSLNSKKQLELKICTNKNFFINNIYSKKNKDEKIAILKIFKNKKRKKKNKNIYSEILDKSPKSKKTSLIYKSKVKYLQLQNKDKENKKLKANLKKLIYKSLSIKKKKKKLDKINNGYLENLSKLEHRLEKYYKVLKNDKNYLKTISLNEIISDFENDLNKNGKMKIFNLIKKSLKLKSNDFENKNLLKKNLEFKKNFNFRKKSFALTPNFNNKSKCRKDKRFSIFFKKKKISFFKENAKSISISKSKSRSKKNLRLENFSKNKKKLKKIINPVDFDILHNLKNTTLLKNIRSKKKKKNSKTKNSLKKNELTILQSSNINFLISDLIKNLKNLKQKKTKTEKTYLEKKIQTKSSIFEKKQFSDIFKKFIKKFLKKNSKSDFKLKDIISHYKKSNFDLKEIDFETQKLLKIYFDCFQKQLVFDEIRKILNEEEVFIEDYFQEGFENLHNKFIEDFSEVSSISNSTSNFTITNFEGDIKNESFRSILSDVVKDKEKRVFKSVQDSKTFFDK